MLDFFDPGEVLMKNFCELFNEPPDSIKDCEIYDQLHKKGFFSLELFS
jgi:hypothetical protein